MSGTGPLAAGAAGSGGGAAARHFPEAEYRTVREAVGIAVRDDLGLVRMHGRDPRRMLNGLITNDLALAGPTRAVYAAMLTPKGRTIVDLRAVVDGDDVLFDHSSAADGPLSEHLKKYVPPLFAGWERMADATVIGVYGPRAAEILRQHLPEIRPDADEDEVVAGEIAGARVFAIATRFAGGEPGWDVWAPADGDPVREALLQAAAAAGGRLVGSTALDILRIEAGRPLFGRELTEETLPGEIYPSEQAMARAISFTKGCYTGQEVVVRIAHRGHVNRYLRGLLLGDAPAPAPDAVLLRPGTDKPVGRITSAAYSPLMGQAVALALVRRELEPGDVVTVGEAGPEARVATLPFKAPP